MDDRKTVAINLDGDEYSLALTIDQVKLLEWCREHCMF